MTKNLLFLKSDLLLLFRKNIRMQVWSLSLCNITKTNIDLPEHTLSNSMLTYNSYFLSHLSGTLKKKCWTTFQQTTKAIFSTNGPISLFALAYKHFNLKCNFLPTSTNTYNILKEGINWNSTKRKKSTINLEWKIIFTLKNNDVFAIAILSFKY